ncbi:uncharacterized protein LOC114740157 [Neltuma alba]|uniref:uncharacterized protein LOC114740157 n=1 Tax=Neltuma alba TaxID=207710 RepID=UPI0010A3F265|nr:uncharacterized protein LOC114740157 [Prosopis alba]
MIQERFQHSGETVSLHFHKVLAACLNLSRENIRPTDPTFSSCHPKITNDPRYFPFFRDAVGAIDGTHINCSAHDARVFHSAISTPSMNFLIHSKKILLVDAGYPSQVGYLGPYRRERYHLPDFNRHPGFTNQNEAFNYYHSSLRSTIERTVGVWKNRQNSPTDDRFIEAEHGSVIDEDNNHAAEISCTHRQSKHGHRRQPVPPSFPIAYSDLALARIAITFRLFSSSSSSKITGILRKSPSPQCFRLLQRYPSPAFSLKFSTGSSPDNHSFTVSYLINSLGFSQEAALNASERVRFETSVKPDSVVSFFRSHGFSESLIHDLIRRDLSLLLCNPCNKILPKFEFLLSKGASTSDIVLMVHKSPRFLKRSLSNHIIPSYELLLGFLHTDEATIDCIKCYPDILYGPRLIQNIELLLKNGVSRTNITLILKRRPRSLSRTDDLAKMVEEIECLGFDPSNSTFYVALLAKISLGKSHWEAKVGVFKRWGWSEEAWSESFRRQPHIMLTSKDKIDAILSFLSNHLGWDPLILAKKPNLLIYSLKRRIIPRAAVLDYLQSEGLIENKAGLTVPFEIPEKQFLERFVKRYEEHNYHLLKLYEEKKEL